MAFSNVEDACRYICVMSDVLVKKMEAMIWAMIEVKPTYDELLDVSAQLFDTVRNNELIDTTNAVICLARYHGYEDIANKFAEALESHGYNLG